MLDVNFENALDVVEKVSGGVDCFEDDAAVGVFERDEAIGSAVGGDGFEGCAGRCGVYNACGEVGVGQEFVGGLFGERAGNAGDGDLGVLITETSLTELGNLSYT